MFSLFTFVAGAFPLDKMKLGEEARQQRLQALNERKAGKALPKQASGQLAQARSHDLTDEAVPSEAPFRDTSASSDSGRAGQNGARAGPNGLQGRLLQPAKQAGSANGPAINPAAARRLDRHEAARQRSLRDEEMRNARSERESSRSGDSSGAGAGQKGEPQRGLGPSRLGPGRGSSKAGAPNAAEQVRNGRKRQLQVFVHTQLLDTRKMLLGLLDMLRAI